MASQIHYSAKNGDIDVDVGRTHIHLHQQSRGGTDIDVSQRPSNPSPASTAPPSTGDSPIKRLNDALGELTTSYTSAISELEKSAEHALAASERSPRNRWSSNEVSSEKRVLESDKAVQALLARRNLSSYTSPSRSAALSSPYLDVLASPLSNYTTQYLKERRVVRTLLDIASSSAPVKEVYDASADLRKWLLDYSTLGPYLTGKLLAVVTKVQDLLQEVEKKDNAYAELMKAMKEKEEIVQNMEIKFDAQTKNNAATVNRLILVTADLQAQLKASTQAEMQNLKAYEDARARVISLEALSNELKVQLKGSMDRERYAKTQLITQAAAAKQAMAEQEAAFARREKVLNAQLASVQDAETKTAELNIMLETDKRKLENEVKNLQDDNKELSLELAQALEIAKTFEKSLEQELQVVDFWNTQVKNVSTTVLGPAATMTTSLEDQLPLVGNAYQGKARELKTTSAALLLLQQEFKSLRQLESAERTALMAEHAKAKELAKKLVDEEHQEEELETMLCYALKKNREMRDILIRNDSRHKEKEAALENKLVDLREGQRKEKLEMNETLERTRIKVEEAKKLAENAQNLSKMMRLYDDDKVLAARGLLR